MLQFRCDKDGKLHSTIYAENGGWYCEKHVDILTREKINAAMGELNGWKKTTRLRAKASNYLNE